MASATSPWATPPSFSFPTYTNNEFARRNAHVSMKEQLWNSGFGPFSSGAVGTALSTPGVLQVPPSKDPVKAWGGKHQISTGRPVFHTIPSSPSSSCFQTFLSPFHENCKWSPSQPGRHKTFPRQIRIPASNLGEIPAPDFFPRAQILWPVTILLPALQYRTQICLPL